MRLFPRPLSRLFTFADLKPEGFARHIALVNNRWVIAACWVGSIALAVLATRILHAPPEPAVSEPEIVEVPVYLPAEEIWPGRMDLQPRADDDAAAESADTAGRSANAFEPEPTRLGEPEAISPAKMHQTLQMALLSHDVIGSNLVMAHLLANLTPENLPEAIRAFEEAPRSGLRDHNYRLFLHAWGKMDGEAAMAYFGSLKKHEQVHGGGSMAMSGWAEVDAAAALDFVEAVDAENPKHGAHLSHALVRGWLKTDLDAATDFVRTHEKPGRRKHLMGELARGTIRDHGTGTALDMIDRSTRVAAGGTEGDIQFRNMVFDEMMKNMRPENAPEVAMWIDSNPEHPDLEDWVYQKVSRDYVQEDAASARNWVENYRLSGSERFNYGVIGNFAGAWAQDDPYTAMEWAANMDMPSRQSSAYSQIANRWDENDLESAEAWLEAGRENPLMDDARRRYSMRIAENDPVRGLEYATQIMRRDYREESMVNAARILVQRNPAAVDAWLPVSGLGPEAQASIFRPAGNGR